MTDLEQKAREIVEQTALQAGDNESHSPNGVDKKLLHERIVNALRDVREADAKVCDVLASGGGTVAEDGVIRPVTALDCAAALRKGVK